MDRLGSDVVKENTIAYAKQMLSNIFPNVIDGFKKVKRRILNTQPKEGFFKGQNLISNAINIHPYNDKSIYDAACRLTEQFRYPFPLLNLKGNGGSYGGDIAPHARYTDFKLSEFYKDVFINGIDISTIPTEPTEDLSGNEIKYFIPKIPTALLYGNESIGFGYSSYTIPLLFENICKITIDFIGCKDKIKWDHSRLAELFVPSFPIHVMIKNYDKVVDSYRKGVFTEIVETEGFYYITSYNVLMIRTFAYEGYPKVVYEKLLDMLRDKNSWLFNNVGDTNPIISSSKDQFYADIQITFKRTSNIFECVDKLKNILQLRTSTHPINNYVFNDQMYDLDPPQVIQMWYKERYRSVFSAKKHKQQELQLLKTKLTTYLLVCNHIEDVIAIIKKYKIHDKICDILKERYNLTLRQCDILLNTNLSTLVKAKHTELSEKLEKTEQEIKDLNNSFVNIDQELIDDIKALMKRYKTDTSVTSRVSDFIGCILIKDHGIIQVSSYEEALDVFGMFKNNKLLFIEYNSDIYNISFARSSLSYDNINCLPYMTMAHGISFEVKEKPYLFTRNNDKSVCLENQSISIDTRIFNHVSKEALVVLSDGIIDKADEDLFTNRKKSTDVLFAFDPDPNEKYIVISINDAHEGVIRFQKITHMSKVMLSYDDKTTILDIIPINIDEKIINFPANKKHSVVYLRNISSYLVKKINDVSMKKFKCF